jgi:hypothetical protein
MAQAATARIAVAPENRPTTGREATQFKKGQTGNAGGRPKKDRALTMALEARLDTKKGRKTRRQLVAEKIVDLAIDGDMTAAKFLADRTEGLPIQWHRFDPEDVRQQAEALAAEMDAPIETVEPMLKRHLTLVQ